MIYKCKQFDFFNTNIEMWIWVFVFVLVVILAYLAFSLKITGGNELVLRKYKKTDALKVSKINESFHSKHPQPPLSYFQEKNGWVLTDKKEVVAFLLYTDFITSDDESYYYLAAIGTHPDYQKQGLGHTLITEFHKFATIPTFLNVELDTPLTDILLQWYSKYGYEFKQDSESSKVKGVFFRMMVRE
jgi:ribosomal protein S18 acetylase RimI-like enzyme